MNHPLNALPKRDVTRSKLPGSTYSASVRSNVGKDFLKLLDEAFPPSNPLHKLFTRQTVKLSYKCMPNMAQAVASQNKKILNEDGQQPTQPPCLSRNWPWYQKNGPPLDPPISYQDVDLPSWTWTLRRRQNLASQLNWPLIS